MPTYVYRCTKGHTFELFHAMSDDAPKRCPKCKSRAKRVPAGGAGLLFKGSGFYITENRSASYREKAKSESGGGKSEGAAKKPEAGTAKKPEAGAAKRPEGGAAKKSSES